MKKILTSATVVVALMLALASCGGGSSPKAAAEKFLNGLFHMNYADAKSVATEETKKQVEAMEQMGTLMGDKEKKEAGDIKVEVKEPVMENDSMATVEYTRSDNPTPMTLKMVKRNGNWLAQWSKMDGMGDMPNPADAGGEMMPDPMDTTMAPPAEAPMEEAPAETK